MSAMQHSAHRPAELLSSDKADPAEHCCCAAQAIKAVETLLREGGTKKQVQDVLKDAGLRTAERVSCRYTCASWPPQ